MLSGSSFGYEVIRSYKTYELVRCPYHNDNHPSGLFFRKDAKFKCLGCGKVVRHDTGKGYEGTDAEELSILPHSLGLFRDPVNYLDNTSEDFSPELVNYVTQRGISPATCYAYSCREKFDNGYRQLVMPQATLSGHVIGTVSRLATFDEVPRRYYIAGDRVPAWPLHEVRPTQDIIFVSEGGIKAMAIYQAMQDTLTDGEFDAYSSVATMGSLWTKQMAELYSQLADKIVLIADNDKSGLAFAERFKSIGARAFKVKVPFDDMGQDERNEMFVKLLERTKNNGFRKLYTGLAA